MTEADIFIEEALELLDEVESGILQLQKKPGEVDLVNKLFRDLHTVKGSGAMFGFDQVADFTHELENVIGLIRKGEIDFSPELADPFLASRDHIIKIIEHHGDNSEEINKESQEILDRIDTIIAGDEKSTESVNRKSFTKLKMLIVEDEFTSRFIMQDFLSVYGSPLIAIDGYEAIQAIKKSLVEGKPYDLVCLDIKMPGMDGKKVSEEIRRLETEMATGRHCRIVMISTIDEQEVIDDMVNNKYCDLYLVKPMSVNKMAEFIENTEW